MDDLQKKSVSIKDKKVLIAIGAIAVLFVGFGLGYIFREPLFKMGTQNQAMTNSENTAAQQNEKESDIVTFDGVGVITAYEGELRVVKTVIKDSPADEAGLEIGDVIYKVNGENVYGKGYIGSENMLADSESGSFKIAAYRISSEETIEVELEKEEITFDWEDYGGRPSEEDEAVLSSDDLRTLVKTLEGDYLVTPELIKSSLSNKPDEDGKVLVDLALTEQEYGCFSLEVTQGDRIYVASEDIDDLEFQEEGEYYTYALDLEDLGIQEGEYSVTAKTCVEVINDEDEIEKIDGTASVVEGLKYEKVAPTPTPEPSPTMGPTPTSVPLPIPSIQTDPNPNANGSKIVLHAKGLDYATKKDYMGRDYRPQDPSISLIINGQSTYTFKLNEGVSEHVYTHTSKIDSSNVKILVSGWILNRIDKIDKLVIDGVSYEMEDAYFVADRGLCSNGFVGEKPKCGGRYDLSFDNQDEIQETTIKVLVDSKYEPYYMGPIKGRLALSLTGLGTLASTETNEGEFWYEFKVHYKPTPEEVVLKQTRSFLDSKNFVIKEVKIDNDKYKAVEKYGSYGSTYILSK